MSESGYSNLDEGNGREAIYDRADHWVSARSGGPLGQGQAIGRTCWRHEYGGLKLDQAKRLKDLERENDRLKRAVSELTLDKLILKEALEGKY